MPSAPVPGLHWIDYAILGGYLAAALTFGISMSRRAGRNSESYFLGGRSLPWWVNGISLAATSFASDTPLVVTEMVRGRGLQRLWWLFAGVFALVVGVYLFARLWRRLEIMTDAEFCELRYDGRSASALRAVRAFMSGVVGNLLTMAWVTLGMVSILTVTMPIGRWTAIGCALGVTLIYTMFGGFVAAVLTDVLQFGIAVSATLLLAVVSVWKFGGLDSVRKAVEAAPGFGSHTLSLFPNFHHAGLDLASFLILLTLWWTDAGGYVMQRMSACRNECDSVKAMLLFACWQAIRPWMWAVVGLVSIALFPVLPMGYTDTQAYPLVMQHYLGIGLRGLLITAFVSAFMSTMTTQLNWGASYLVRDNYCRFLRPHASDRECVLVSRLMTILLAVTSLALTPLLTSITQAWEFLWFLTAGSGLIAVFRWFWWRINAWTELAALLTGFACALFNLVAPAVWHGFSFFHTPWVALRFEIKLVIFTSIVVIISIAATYVTPPVSAEKLRAFCARARPGGFWGSFAPSPDPLRHSVLTGRTIIDIFGGLALCLGATVGIGFGILGQTVPSLASFVIAAAGAWAVYRWFRRETRVSVR